MNNFNYLIDKPSPDGATYSKKLLVNTEKTQTPISSFYVNQHRTR